ncbi:MAG: ABC transporter permease [Thermoplasmata archaeon]
MSHILSDTVNFGKQYVRMKMGMFFAIAFPILLILVFGAIFMGGGSSKIVLYVQNQDNGSMGDQFVDSMNRTGLFEIRNIPDNESIERFITNNSLTVAVQIPKNFTYDIGMRVALGIEGYVNVTVYGDPSKTTYNMVLGAVSAVAEGMNFALTGTQPVIGASGKSITPAQKFNYMDFYLPGIIGITVMVNTLYVMTGTCAEYKQRSYFKLLATTNIKKWEWLVSKFIFYAVLLSFALVLTYLVGRMAFDMQSILTPMAFVLIAAGAFTFTAIGMFVGILVKDPEGATAIANAIGFPMMFLSGSFIPLEIMPDYLQAVASVIPLTYLNNGLRDTMLYFNDASALVNLAIVFACGMIFFLLASKYMSWKEK